MDTQGNQLQRQLAPLKVVSRLLGHELHAQGTAKSLTLSREAAVEIQTTLDLFIEEAYRRTGTPGSMSGSMGGAAANLPTAGETHLVPTRN